MIVQSRGALKKLLADNSGLYKLGKFAYGGIKSRFDRSKFKSIYPNADYILFSKDRINSLRKQGYHSQFGQDSYLFEHTFGGKKDGFFVEIGANDPHWNSNSAFLEKQGWRGLAFEPQSRFQAAWLAGRKSPLHRVAITSEEGTADFIEFHGTWEHQLSGFKEFVRPEDTKMFSFDTYSVRCAPLSSFLKSGQVIDLLMIDVEGAEESVLRGIDFKAVKPAYMMIENDAVLGGDERLRNIVKAHGYRLIARIGATDDLFESLP